MQLQYCKIVIILSSYFEKSTNMIAFNRYYRLVSSNVMSSCFLKHRGISRGGHGTNKTNYGTGTPYVLKLYCGTGNGTKNKIHPGT